VSAGEFFHDISHKMLGVAEEHQGFIQVVQRVIDAGKAGVHAAFDHHHGSRFVHIEDGYAAAQALASIITRW